MLHFYTAKYTKSYFDFAIVLSANQISVRLVGGDNSSSGRVEVNYNGMEWGTICDDKYVRM